MYWYKFFEEDEVIDQNILASNFVMVDGIYNSKSEYSRSQSQTSDAFGYKWGKTESYESYESNEVRNDAKAWLIKRYFDNDITNRKKYIKNGAKFLDAGCGSCFSSLALFEDIMNDINFLGVDISGAVNISKETFEKKGINGEFLRTSLTEFPFTKPCFDVIFSEGVLHHTDSTEKSFKYLADLLLPDGVIMAYVYKKKSPVREYTDDLIRDYLQQFDDEESWRQLMPLTKLGKALGDLNIEIDIEDDIPYLGIKAGRQNLQRLFYYDFCKAYYRQNWNLEEMNHVNFDWFRPLNCHRHTVDEIEEWCSECNLKIEHIDVEPSGITFIARKFITKQ